MSNNNEGFSLHTLLWPIAIGALVGLLLLAATQWLAPRQAGQAVLTSLAPAAELASPAVVNIYTSNIVRSRNHPLLNDPFFSRFFKDLAPPRQEQIQRSLGSGVIIRADGYIVTNNHVISGADEILVLLADGRESLATVVGSDPETDIAVLKIAFEELPAITFAESSRVRVGDIVLAIGNPYGFGQSVTQGIVSATGRYGLNINAFENYIQTDAAINQGNSGGALVDIDGRLLGINTAIFSKSGGSIGIGLAVPAGTVEMVSAAIIQEGKVQRGWLGVAVQDLTKADDNGLRRSAVVITNLYKNGPALNAGLRIGDQLTEINGQGFIDANNAMNLIAMVKPGEEIDITARRGDERIDARVLIGERQ